MKNTGQHAYVNNLHKAKDSNYSKSHVKHFPCIEGKEENQLDATITVY